MKCTFCIAPPRPRLVNGSGTPLFVSSSISFPPSLPLCLLPSQSHYLLLYGIFFPLSPSSLGLLLSASLSLSFPLSLLTPLYLYPPPPVSQPPLSPFLSVLSVFLSLSPDVSPPLPLSLPPFFFPFLKFPLIFLAHKFTVF
jgi:hypothetical protein